MSAHKALSWIFQKSVASRILVFDFEFFIGVRRSNRGISLSHRYVAIIGHLNRRAELVSSTLAIVTFYTTISVLS